MVFHEDSQMIKDKTLIFRMCLFLKKIQRHGIINNSLTEARWLSKSVLQVVGFTEILLDTANKAPIVKYIFKSIF